MNVRQNGTDDDRKYWYAALEAETPNFHFIPTFVFYFRIFSQDNGTRWLWRDRILSLNS